MNRTDLAIDKEIVGSRGRLKAGRLMLRIHPSEEATVAVPAQKRGGLNRGRLAEGTYGSHVQLSIEAHDCFVLAVSHS